MVGSQIPSVLGQRWHSHVNYCQVYCYLFRDSRNERGTFAEPFLNSYGHIMWFSNLAMYEASHSPNGLTNWAWISMLSLLLIQISITQCRKDFKNLDTQESKLYILIGIPTQRFLFRVYRQSCWTRTGRQNLKWETSNPNQWYLLEVWGVWDSLWVVREF